MGKFQNDRLRKPYKQELLNISSAFCIMSNAVELMHCRVGFHKHFILYAICDLILIVHEHIYIVTHETEYITYNALGIGIQTSHLHGMGFYIDLLSVSYIFNMATINIVFGGKF